MTLESLRIARNKVRFPQCGLFALLTIGTIVVHIVFSSRLQIDVHRGLGTSSYDVGLYDQGVWLLSRFDAPFVTLMGRNMFGDHASIVMLLVVPLYWVIPGTETLLVVQSIVIALGAVPIFFFAKRTLGNEMWGFLFALSWLMNPAVNGALYENFHPDSFLGLFVPIALYGALTKRWRIFVVGAVLSALVKEDVSLVLVPMGIMLAIRGDRRKGILTVVGAIAASLAGMFLLMKPLIGVATRNVWRIPFGGVSGFFKELFTDPRSVYRYMTSEGRLFYVWQMTVPFAFIFALAPEVMLVSLLVLATNVISTFWYQFHIGYHYSLVVVPGLVFASIVGLSRLRGVNRTVAACLMTVAMLVSAMSWSVLPLSQNTIPHWAASHPVALAAQEIIKKVPEKARISVYHSLAPHLAHRTHIYQFPNPFRIVLYGTDISLEGGRLAQSDRIEYVVLPVELDEQATKDLASIADDFFIVESNTWWRLYKRNSPSVNP